MPIYAFGELAPGQAVLFRQQEVEAVTTILESVGLENLEPAIRGLESIVRESGGGCDFDRKWGAGV